MRVLFAAAGLVIATSSALADTTDPTAAATEQLSETAPGSKLPVLLALDGGSLAMPSTSAGGVAAAAVIRMDPRSIGGCIAGLLNWDGTKCVSAAQESDATGFAEIAGLQLTDSTNIGVRLETASFRLPRLDISSGGIAHTVAREHVASVGLLAAHGLWWGEIRVASRDETPGGMAEFGVRPHGANWSVFAGASLLHLRPIEESATVRPAYSDGRLVAAIVYALHSRVDVGAYASASRGTWVDSISTKAREWESHLELGAAARVSISSVEVGLAFHVLEPIAGEDKTQLAISIISSAHH